MKKLVTTAFLLVLCSHLMGQITTSSPYSRFALGELNTLSLAQNSALGGSTVSLVDSFQVNILNPASYSFAAYQSPIFDFSVTGRFVNLSTSTASATTNYGSPNNIALVMPFTHRWGTALGLVTYSSTGYRIVSTYDDPALQDEVTAAYTGSGNINRAFLGTSYMIIDHNVNKEEKNPTRDQLSLGVNASYLFGNIEKKRQIYLPSQTGMLDGEITNSLFARDFMFDGGILYRHNMDIIKKDSLGKIKSQRGQQLTFGASASLGRDTRFHRSVFARTFLQNQTSYADTVQYVEAEKGTIYIPARYTFGLTYDIKGEQGSKNFYKLSFTAQYQTQNWTLYKENFESGSSSDSLRQGRNFGFGVQFIPHQLGYSSGKINFLKIINYRAGFYTSDQYLNVDNSNNIRAWGVTAGFGLPLIHSASYTMLNLAFEYGQRGTHNNGLVLEKYYGFHIGIAFTPSRIDRWFIKRKYD